MKITSKIVLTDNCVRAVNNHNSPVSTYKSVSLVCIAHTQAGFFLAPGRQNRRGGKCHSQLCFAQQKT